MSLYARSDLSATNLSAAHGGCGQKHIRPAPGGNPVNIWKLDCVACEGHFRTDPLWSSTVSEIPETHDQVADREDWQKRGAQDRDAIMPVLLAKLAGVDPAQLPESLTRAISGTNLHIPGVMECPKGHAQPSGQAFCGKCGTPMHEAAPAVEAPPPLRAPIPAAAEPEDGPAPSLANLHPQKLRKMCRENGLNDTGTRPEMIARLEAAGKVAA